MYIHTVSTFNQMSRKSTLSSDWFLFKHFRSWLVLKVTIAVRHENEKRKQEEEKWFLFLFFLFFSEINYTDFFSGQIGI